MIPTLEADATAAAVTTTPAAFAALDESYERLPIEQIVPSKTNPTVRRPQKPDDQRAEGLDCRPRPLRHRPRREGGAAAV
jgi:hypothetical protein